VLWKKRFFLVFIINMVKNIASLPS
jgi:hypothetical protein